MSDKAIKNEIAYQLLNGDGFTNAVIKHEKELTKEAFSAFMDRLFVCFFLWIRDKKEHSLNTINEFVSAELLPNIGSYIIKLWP